MIEPTIAIMIGAFFATSIYLLLSESLIRMLLGVAILGNAVNMMIFTGGRLVREVPPIIPYGASVPDDSAANALPQALVLTAIVISFSIFAFMLVLAFRAYQATGNDRTPQMNAAEPKDDNTPPVGY